MILCHSMNAGSHGVVGTLESYHMQKNLFDLFAFTYMPGIQTKFTSGCPPRATIVQL